MLMNRPYLLVALLAAMIALPAMAAGNPKQSAIDQRTGQLVTFDVINGYAYLDDIGLGRVEDIERDGLIVPSPLSLESLQVPAGRIRPKDGLYRSAIRWQQPIPYIVSSPTLGANAY